MYCLEWGIVTIVLLLAYTIFNIFMWLSYEKRKIFKVWTHILHLNPDNQSFQVITTLKLTSKFIKCGITAYLASFQSKPENLQNKFKNEWLQLLNNNLFLGYRKNHSDFGFKKLANYIALFSSRVSSPAI